MKNLKKSYVVYLLLSILFVACKKDDSNTTATPVSLRGIYTFSSSSNFEVFRWGAGGSEITISEIEKNELLDELDSYTEDGYYNFISDSVMYFVDTVNQTTDTVKYKVTGDVVYIDVRDIPFFGVDYYPLFKVSGSTLYSNYYYVNFEDQSGASGIGMQTVENINLVDTVLAEMGYSSLADLKADEQLTYMHHKKNYKK